MSTEISVFRLLLTADTLVFTILIFIFWPSRADIYFDMRADQSEFIDGASIGGNFLDGAEESSAYETL